MLLSLIVAVILSVLAVFFANDNQELIRIQIYGLQLQGKAGIFMVAAFGLGAVCGIIALLPAYLSQGWALIRSRRKVEDLERLAKGGSISTSKQV